MNHNYINHPEYGRLEVRDRIGRSRVCVKEDGTSVTLSARVLNALAGRGQGPTTVEPEAFVASVREYLLALGDGPVQQATARDVWKVADVVLGNPPMGQP